MKNPLSDGELDKIDFINSCEINYCNWYPEDKTHPVLKLSFCSNCEKPIPGVDESIIRMLVHLTNEFRFLK